MKYENVVEAVFQERPNRFIAYVDREGQKEKVHVKNTGRCRELLKEGATVYLAPGEGKERKTAHDLVAVKKGDRIVNIDSQAPNKALGEWINESGYFGGITFYKPEAIYGDSRLDFYLECGERKIFIETKGVTLEENGVVRFPDAPSERAVKHLKELRRAVKEGYEAYVIFVIQMEGVNYFCANEDTHKEFADMLFEVSMDGVQILALDCKVTADEMIVNQEVPVCLGPKAYWKDAINKPLLQWYDQNRRILPWREEPTPYRV